MTVLLLDLDNTLLENPVQQFVPAYLKLFASYISPIVDPKLFSKSLMASTDQMIANDNFQITLRSAFEDSFFKSFKDQRIELSKAMDDFYRTLYPTLKPFTHSRDAAIALINNWTSKNSKIVVATNPLFPDFVQFQRLEWANLSISDYPQISFVTSYEKMHFAKPNPAYYMEILALLGWPQEPVCMIGDTYTDDIQPSTIFGINGFFVCNENCLSDSIPGHVPSGTLSDANLWIEQANSTLCFETKESIIFELLGSSAALHTLYTNRSNLTSIPDEIFTGIFSDLYSFEHQFSWVRQSVNEPSNLIFTSDIFFTGRNSLIQIINELSDEDLIKQYSDLQSIINHDQAVNRSLVTSISSNNDQYLRKLLYD
jgi:FMN phosphatase YigB (HAD superfamily)